MAESNGSWNLNIETIEHQSGLVRPVFHWVYENAGLCGGDVYALPEREGLFFFQTRRGDYTEPLKLTHKQLLKELETYGWGNPPHLKEVEKDCKEATKILHDEKGNPQRFIEYCSKMQDKWGKILNKTLNA
jgi:hypothetical protein